MEDSIRYEIRMPCLLATATQLNREVGDLSSRQITATAVILRQYISLTFDPPQTSFANKVRRKKQTDHSMMGETMRETLSHYGSLGVNGSRRSCLPAGLRSAEEEESAKMPMCSERARQGGRLPRKEHARSRSEAKRLLKRLTQLPRRLLLQVTLTTSRQVRCG